MKYVLVYNKISEFIPQEKKLSYGISYGSFNYTFYFENISSDKLKEKDFFGLL
jgi:hypothetical protein